MENLGKGIEYYLALPWEIKLKKIPESDGGGWEASIPLLGEWRCRGYGPSREKALRNLDIVLKELIQEYIEEKREIPEPKGRGLESEENYSGKLLLRIPGSLHYFLSKQARASAISLNSYLIHLLSLNSPLARFGQDLQQIEARLSILIEKKKCETTSELLSKLENFGIETLMRDSARSIASWAQGPKISRPSRRCKLSLKIIQGRKTEGGENEKANAV